MKKHTLFLTVILAGLSIREGQAAHLTPEPPESQGSGTTDSIVFAPLSFTELDPLPPLNSSTDRKDTKYTSPSIRYKGPTINTERETDEQGEPLFPPASRAPSPTAFTAPGSSANEVAAVLATSTAGAVAPAVTPAEESATS